MKNNVFIKFLSLVLILVLLCGCDINVNNGNDYNLMDVKEELEKNIDFDNLKDGDKLPTELLGFTLKYEGSDSKLISSDGVISADNADRTISIVVIAEDDLNEARFTFNCFIIGKNNEDNPGGEENPKDYPIELSQYYMSCLNLYGQELLLELRSITTKSHKTVLSYGDLRYKTIYTDRDPNNPNNIILFYTKKSVKATWDGGSTWNREHVWPQSYLWGNTQAGAGADIHHVRPANPSVNSSRGNKKFADTEMNGYYVPNDNVKGDIARIIFYLKVRYSESDSYPFTTVCYSLDMLLEWNELDPVDNYEITRNIEAQKLQGNYNPFIDYPEFARLIWD